MEQKQNEQTILKEKENILEEMMKAGVHYGRAKRFTHPTMTPFLLKSNRNIEFFNLKITLEKLHQTADYLKNALEENKKILFVGITPASQTKIQEMAMKLGQYYITYKWVGGFLTNFQTIQARLLYYRDLLEKEKNGELANYPPLERSRLERELAKLKNLYSGVVNLESLPDVVFIVNLAFKQHKTALRECLKMKIPVIAVAGSDNDISRVHLFIPGNDKAPKSIAWIIDYLLSLIINQ